MRVLVVEPDCRTAEHLVHWLVRHGYEVDLVDTGRRTLEVAATADLVLLDLGLPDLDGIEVCRSLRDRTDAPLITFTGSGTELDRVLSLQAGADDCMVKPYGLRELVARMEAVMRRVLPRGRGVRGLIAHGTLEIDLDRRQVRVRGNDVELTRKEFELLRILASRPESVITRRELMSRVWEDDWAASTRTIDTHVSSLRHKLGDAEWIVTVRGVGYRLGSGSLTNAAAQVQPLV
ncbi:response regulator transcription factor [Actinomadura rayongensis]|uniref:Response regulator n=1 Tax=Actinomadura rayongensis TaxID=1429076 RepID=A0A6I4WKK2_9ACTN|nr:response regulator transcription factor [Actinomadura rayongensis]MXQ68236.1 response regulator [Actinomadura rayongensis]